MVTGHSLGGALAHLAALDVQRELELDPDQMCCYTFGVPRVGNHAFAHVYDAAVPDTWNLVNGLDVVPLSLKFMLWQVRGSRFRGRYMRYGDKGFVV